MPIALPHSFSWLDNDHSKVALGSYRDTTIVKNVGRKAYSYTYILLDPTNRNGTKQDITRSVCNNSIDCCNDNSFTGCTVQSVQWEYLRKLLVDLHRSSLRGHWY